MKGRISHSLYGRGIFSFSFEEKADRDMIFKSDPYFMAGIGMYLNRWNPYFNFENDILLDILIYLRIPFLPNQY